MQGNAKLINPKILKLSGGLIMRYSLNECSPSFVKIFNLS